MDLKLLGKAKYTFYGFNNSSVQLYQETTRYKKKGDTIYMRSRTYFLDTTKIAKTFYPQYVISGDSLVSLDYDVAYIKK